MSARTELTLPVEWKQLITACPVVYTVWILLAGNGLYYEPLNQLVVLCSLLFPFAVIYDVYALREHTGWPKYPSAYILPSCVPFLSLISAAFYLKRRDRVVSEPVEANITISVPWHHIAAAGTVIWAVWLVMAVNGVYPVVLTGLLPVNWLVTAVALTYDVCRVQKQTEWPKYRGLYLVPAWIPFLGVVPSFVYLLRRDRIVS